MADVDGVLSIQLSIRHLMMVDVVCLFCHHPHGTSCHYNSWQLMVGLFSSYPHGKASLFLFLFLFFIFFPSGWSVYLAVFRRRDTIKWVGSNSGFPTCRPDWKGVRPSGLAVCQMSTAVCSRPRNSTASWHVPPRAVGHCRNLTRIFVS